jgi:hypothetical protein
VFGEIFCEVLQLSSVQFAVAIRVEGHCVGHDLVDTRRAASPPPASTVAASSAATTRTTAARTTRTAVAAGSSSAGTLTSGTTARAATVIAWTSGTIGSPLLLWITPESFFATASRSGSAGTTVRMQFVGRELSVRIFV